MKQRDAQNDEVHEITGTVKSILYRNEESGYTVCLVHTRERDEPVSVVGNTAAIWEGEELRASGEWVRHPRHGFQLKASAITCIAPTSEEGIRRFLASGMIRGIGKVNANRIVDAFKADTLKIIESNSCRLEEVEGIGPKRRVLIKESWNEQRSVRDIMIFLQANGVGTAQAARIYRQYGNDAIAIVKSNPYRLCHDIWGIGFKTADAIAANVGIPRESPQRAEAGLLYTLHTQTKRPQCQWLLQKLWIRSVRR